MSEFGKGYAYCLGLFLAHAERGKEYKKMQEEIPTLDAVSLWFNAAADHLYELEIPEKLSDEQKTEVSDWRNLCLKYRLNMDSKKLTWTDVNDALDKAKKFLMEWDVICGIPSEKGEYE